MQIPSVLFFDKDGEVVVGEAAERRGVTEPTRLVREFKRRLGDQVPLLVAGAPYSAEMLMARMLRWVVSTTAAQLGEAPEAIICTRPANWGPYKRELFDQVINLAELSDVQQCTEPEAAAAQYAARTTMTPGDRIAVYDLGGGTFDVCVLEMQTDRFVLLGSPGGVEHLGGVDFDEAVTGFVLHALGDRVRKLNSDDPATTAGLARLRRDCVEAKEALSIDLEANVSVALPGLNTIVRITRRDLESAIRPAISDTVAALRRSLMSANTKPTELSAIVLVGGSSRIPLVTEMLHQELQVPVALDTHPKHDIALGAARLCHPTDRDAEVERRHATARRYRDIDTPTGAPHAPPKNDRERTSRTAPHITRAPRNPHAPPTSPGTPARTTSLNTRQKRSRGTTAILGCVLALALVGGGVVATRLRDHNGSSGPVAETVDMARQGDIEFWGSNLTDQRLVQSFNAQHPSGKVTFHSMTSSDRPTIIQKMQSTDSKMSVVAIDSSWTPELTDNGSLAPLPADLFPSEDLLPVAAESGTSHGTMYAYPSTVDVGLLYYRKDLLGKARISHPPTTWDELETDCDKVLSKPAGNDMGCYAGQYMKYDGLTVNLVEAIDSAGGQVLGADGEPDVDTPQSRQGLNRLVTLFKDGSIPKSAITWTEEDGRQAFQSDHLIFHRNWSYVYNLANADDPSSKVAGKVGVAPLPGETGPGIAVVSGTNLAIPANAENKGTAVDLIRFLTAPENQKQRMLDDATLPTLRSVYHDRDLVKRFPYLPVVLRSADNAKLRPRAIRYDAVTLAIQDATYSALQGKTTSAEALQGLQKRLTALIR